MRRILFILFISAILIGCQAPDSQSDRLEASPSVVETIDAPVATMTQLPLLLSATPQGSTPTTELAIPAAGPTATAIVEPQPANPVQPTPTVQLTAYPLEQAAQPAIPTWTFRVINEYPHDPTAFTQGLVIEANGRTLLEGTGRDSSLRRVDLPSGNVEQYYALPDTYFGEGITLFENKIYQLTWRSEVGFIYKSDTFEQLGEFHYPHQGWGLTHDGRNLIVSDGTATIRFWDPDTFEEVRRIEVMDSNGPVTELNELEYVKGEIWANVWHTDLIARISPEDGRVLSWIDLEGLLDVQFRPDPEAVLNGIAYDEQNGRLFVTGKYWPTLFEIEVVEMDDPSAIQN